MDVKNSISCGNASTSCAEHQLTCIDTGGVIAIQNATYGYTANCSDLSDNRQCTEYLNRCCSVKSTDCFKDFAESDLNLLKQKCSGKDSCSLPGFTGILPDCNSSRNAHGIVQYQCIEGQVYGGSHIGVIVGCGIAVLIFTVIIVATVFVRRRRKRRQHEDPTFRNKLYINNIEASALPTTFLELSNDTETAPYASSSVAIPNNTENKIADEPVELNSKENNNDDSHLRQSNKYDELKEDNPYETRPLHIGRENRNSFFKPISVDPNPSEINRKSQFMLEEVAPPEPEQPIRLLLPDTDDTSKNSNSLFLTIDGTLEERGNV